MQIKIKHELEIENKDLDRLGNLLVSIAIEHDRSKETYLYDCTLNEVKELIALAFEKGVEAGKAEGGQL